MQSNQLDNTMQCLTRTWIPTDTGFESSDGAARIGSFGKKWILVLYCDGGTVYLTNRHLMIEEAESVIAGQSLRLKHKVYPSIDALLSANMDRVTLSKERRRQRRVERLLAVAAEADREAQALRLEIVRIQQALAPRPSVATID